MALNNNEINDNVIDLNIDSIKKQRFRINGDPDSIIELNLSDLNIHDRLEKGVDKLAEEMSTIANLSDDDADISEKMKQANEKMCEWLDYIFDSPISKVFSKGGAMFDPINGMFRYEHILDKLTQLYTDNLNEEYKKLKTRISKHTDKYTGNSSKKIKSRKS